MGGGRAPVAMHLRPLEGAQPVVESSGPPVVLLLSPGEFVLSARDAPSARVQGATFLRYRTALKVEFSVFFS